MRRYESVELSSDFFRGQKIQAGLSTKGRRKGKKYVGDIELRGIISPERAPDILQECLDDLTD